ncbi:hypothetical protein [Nocardia pseudobrasiliensis]|uniref:hypothetical protein n=1 Tax=Nocardia pseudobrasiliensis TaxID=45979 RepID=UPI0012E7F740|nr:hypothetical protein [Nocardia pseudobrasiliensis]
MGGEVGDGFGQYFFDGIDGIDVLLDHRFQGAIRTSGRVRELGSERCARRKITEAGNTTDATDQVKDLLQPSDVIVTDTIEPSAYLRIESQLLVICLSEQPLPLVGTYSNRHHSPYQLGRY